MLLLLIFLLNIEWCSNISYYMIFVQLFLHIIKKYYLKFAYFALSNIIQWNFQSKWYLFRIHDLVYIIEKEWKDPETEVTIAVGTCDIDWTINLFTTFLYFASNRLLHTLTSIESICPRCQNRKSEPTKVFKVLVWGNCKWKHKINVFWINLHLKKVWISGKYPKSTIA